MLFCGESAFAQTTFDYPVLNRAATDIRPSASRTKRNLRDKVFNNLAVNQNKSSAQNSAPKIASGDGAVNAGFSPSVTEAYGFVEETIVQADGKIVVGGLFDGANNAERRALLRLAADGSFDPTFNPGGAGPNASVYALAQQPDGKILIGGFFTAYNDTP